MSAALSVRAVGKLHPDLNLRAPTTAEKACQAQRTIARRNRNSAATATKVKPVTMGLIPGNNAAWFNDLPIGILIRILKCVLLFRDVPIHVISRLDPFYQPHTVPSTASGSPTYIRKFHIGTDPVSLSFAPRASILLAPLLVCRRWHYVGSTIFYGDNTFAFSSLGE